MVFLTRVMYFSAAHRLGNPEFSAAKNREIFGVCSSENFHGHNYELHITVQGKPDPETGMVLNFYRVKEIVRAAVIAQVDHRNLNTDVPWLQNQITTVETIVAAFWQQLFPRLNTDDYTLYELKLLETPNNYVVYRGEGNE